MIDFDVAAVDLSGILNKTSEQKAKQLPDPKRFMMLCVIPDAPEEFEDSALIKASQTIHYEEVLTPVLFVVKLGPDCYKDNQILFNCYFHLGVPTQTSLEFGHL